MIRLGLAVLVAGLSVGFSTAMESQESDTVLLHKVVQFNIPNAPAFDFIGVSPDNVTRPSSPKALATSLLSGVDPTGKFQQGLALELSPSQLLLPRMDLREYQSNGGFWLANASISLATTKASGDSTATNIGLGGKIVLLDRSDPSGPASRSAGNAAMQKVLLECAPHRDGHPTPITPQNVGTVKACVASADSVFHVSWRQDHWNDFALSFAAATGWALRNSTWSDRSSMGQAAWLLGAAPICFGRSTQGLCSKGQLLAKAQYESRGSVNASSFKQFIGGVRATMGTESFAVFVESLYRRMTKDKPGATKARTELSGGLEFRLGDETWISSGIGSHYDDVTKKSKAVVVAGMRFNVSPKQQFTSLLPLRR